MHNVLITGVAGFLGSNLANYLLKENYNVVGVDNLISGDLENVNKKVKFYNFDCQDFKNLNKIMKNIDYVFHCASTAHEGLSVFSPVENSKNNIVATTSVVASAVNNKVKKIIYCSSMARYGSQKIPFTEDMKPKPTDPYGIFKVAGEEILKNLCNLNKVDWVIAVPHNIIGPNQKYDDPYRNVISIFLNRMLQKKPPIIYGDGNQKRCFSYIDDCIIPLYKMLNKKITNQIINIGPDEEYVTISKAAEICSNISGSNLKPIFVLERPQEIKEAYCSSDKARKLLGYQTKTSFYDAVKKTYEYIKKRGSKKFKYYLQIEINNELTPHTWKKKII